MQDVSDERRGGTRRRTRNALPAHFSAATNATSGVLNTILFATYYSVAKEALGRIDPIVFSFFEMTSLVPVAFCLILFSWKDMNRAVVKRGIFLGSLLCLSL